MAHALTGQCFPALHSGRSRPVPWAPALRFEIAATGLVLLAAVLVAGAVAHSGGDEASTWTWTAVWLLLSLALGIRPPVRSVRTNLEAPLLAGGLTLIGSVVLDQAVPVVPSMPTHLVLLGRCRPRRRCCAHCSPWRAVHGRWHWCWMGPSSRRLAPPPTGCPSGSDPAS